MAGRLARAAGGDGGHFDAGRRDDGGGYDPDAGRRPRWRADRRHHLLFGGGGRRQRRDAAHLTAGRHRRRRLQAATVGTSVGMSEEDGTTGTRQVNTSADHDHQLTTIL